MLQILQNQRKEAFLRIFSQRNCKYKKHELVPNFALKIDENSTKHYEEIIRDF